MFDQNAPQYLSHASHPGHRLVALPHPPHEQQCRVCRAVSTSSTVPWYACCEGHCGYVLCHKCFEVNERLFPTPQVVLRDPLLPHNDNTVWVHTRPKAESHRLAPLYAAKFAEVVAVAEATDGSGETYYRVRSGGWINSAHVIAVPQDGVIARLSQYHLFMSQYEIEVLQAQECRRAPPAVPASEKISATQLADITEECVELMEKNPHYGIVMTSLTMLPVLNALAEARSEAPSRDNGKGLCDSLVRFLYYVMYATIEEFECDLDDELPILQGTMVPLYQDVLTRCIAAGKDLQTNWHVGLPEGFAGLLLRAIAVLARLHALHDPRTPLIEDTVFLRIASVVTTHLDLSLECHRLYQSEQVSMDAAARLLLSLPSTMSAVRNPLPGEGVATNGLGWDLKSLMPIRDVLTCVENATLERIFCDLTATAVAASRADQRNFLYVDPLEIAARLSKGPAVVDNQRSMFRLIANAARSCPRNISVMACVVMPHLMHMADNCAHPDTLVAAVNCFFELAYNNPRGEATDSAQAERTTPVHTTPNSSPTRVKGIAASCTQALHPEAAPFQLGHVFELENGHLVSLCSSCASQHPPAHAVGAAEPTFLHFTCQCVCCAANAGGLTQTRLPAPTVPQTSALVAMAAAGVPEFLLNCLAYKPPTPELLNAIGRLTLRMRVPSEVPRALLAALLAVPDWRVCMDAALAIACHRHLPTVTEALAEHGTTSLAKYVMEPYAATTTASVCCRRMGDTTGSRSGFMRSTGGLSPSPFDASTHRSSTMDLRGSSLSLHMHSTYPAVDLFPNGVHHVDDVL